MPSDNTPPTTLTTDLRRLGLNRTADDLNDRIADATRKRWSPTVLLEHLVAAELEDRQRRSVERRLTRARLGRFKPLADWDWDWPTALERPVSSNESSRSTSSTRGENVILVGAQGLGKTMLDKEHRPPGRPRWPLRTLHHRRRPAPRPQRPGNCPRPRTPSRGTTSRPALLLIDELGYLAYDARAADLLFQLVSRRYEHRSLLITTNLPFKHWDTVFRAMLPVPSHSSTASPTTSRSSSSRAAAIAAEKLEITQQQRSQPTQVPYPFTRQPAVSRPKMTPLDLESETLTFS